MYNNKNINYNKGQFSSGDELSGDEYSGYNDVIFDNSGSGSETIININNSETRTYVSLFIILGLLIIVGISMFMFNRLSRNDGTEIHRTQDILNNLPEISNENEQQNINTLKSFNINSSRCTEV
uniref:Uncharacterized protein n=1 Tax=Mimiviridae sp. ChoanoV1 TaxID=2596887 RepID=A0A5B8IH41_9VIRU|nr:hypothetical protein 1_170 [Mimiviridae sp. ChoanoV1]